MQLAECFDSVRQPKRRLEPVSPIARDFRENSLFQSFAAVKDFLASNCTVEVALVLPIQSRRRGHA
jgi:hypothetical protein